MPSRRRIATVMNPLYQRIGGHQGISNLLHHFYADVGQDPVIGPIFNAAGIVRPMLASAVPSATLIDL
jgi:truncated hemoglobin YjbI